MRGNPVTEVETGLTSAACRLFAGKAWAELQIGYTIGWLAILGNPISGSVITVLGHYQ